MSKKNKPKKIEVSGEDLKKLEVILRRYNEIIGEDDQDEWDEYAYDLWCKIEGLKQ